MDTATFTPSAVDSRGRVRVSSVWRRAEALRQIAEKRVAPGIQAVPGMTPDGTGPRACAPPAGSALFAGVLLAVVLLAVVLLAVVLLAAVLLAGEVLLAHSPQRDHVARALAVRRVASE